MKDVVRSFVTQEEDYTRFKWACKRMAKIKNFILPYIKGRNVLDLGCADGLYTEWIAMYADNVYGWDIYAPEGNTHDKVVYAKKDWDEVDWSLWSNTFDFILWSEGPEHAEHPEMIIPHLLKISEYLPSKTH